MTRCPSGPRAPSSPCWPPAAWPRPGWPPAAAAGGPTVVTVLGSWTGDEQSGFLAMVRGFERQDRHPGRLHRDPRRRRRAGQRHQGRQPAGPRGAGPPGQLRQDAAYGTLVPIDGALDRPAMARQYGPGWLQLMQAAGAPGARHYYAIIVKAALESVIWYDPRQVPASDLGSADRSPRPDLEPARRACHGLARGPARRRGAWAWRTARLRMAGDRLDRGHRAAPVRAEYLRPVGGRHAALDLGPDPAGLAGLRQRGHLPRPGPRRVPRPRWSPATARLASPMFTRPPGCYLDHEASFITAFYTQDRLGGSGTRTRGRAPTSTSSRSRR